MQCFLLGTGGTMPMPGRHLASAAFRTGGAVYLFDCGEGTQVPYKYCHVGMRGLRVIAVTHLHADHCLGLPGMLMLRAQMEEPDPLVLIGPSGLERFVRHVLRDLSCYVPYPIEFREIDPASDTGNSGPREIYRDDIIRILFQPLAHSVFCVGYRMEEHERPGRFDPEVAVRLGLSPGPDFGALQRGGTVTAPDGREVKPEQVMGPSRRGRHVAFCTDTTPCKGLYHLMDRVDLAVLEGMYLPEHEAEAAEKRHMLAEKAAKIAVRAQVRETLLFHYSPRYSPEDIRRLDAMVKALSPSIRAGREGELVEIPLPP